MDRTDKEFFEQMITLTGYPEWHELVEDLKVMIYQTQCDALEVSSWEKLNEARGFAKGLAYIVNLRDTTLKAREITSATV